LSVPFHRLVHLKNLQIDEVDDEILKLISTCTLLETLSFPSDSIGDVTIEGFEHLTKLKNLTEFWLITNSTPNFLPFVSPECFNQTLGSFEFLRKIQIDDEYDHGVITAETFRQLCCPLEDFDAYLMWNDESIARLCEIKTLKILTIRGVQFKDPVTSWNRLTTLPRLLSLSFDVFCNSVNLDSLEIICRIPSLRMLYFRRSGFFDEWFEQIARLENLEVLECGDDSKITGSGFHHLYGMKSLYKFTVGSSTCEVASLVELQKRMPSLTLKLSDRLEIEVKKYIEDEEAKAGTRRERE
jgi:hypothetical protein